MDEIIKVSIEDGGGWWRECLLSRGMVMVGLQA
jgi:hypothetical protein